MLVKLLEAGTTSARVDLTYGSTEYHKQSLRNLQTAVRKTRRLCAVILDTMGRELVVRREYEVDDKVPFLPPTPIPRQPTPSHSTAQVMNCLAARPSAVAASCSWYPRPIPRRDDQAGCSVQAERHDALDDYI